MSTVLGIDSIRLNLTKYRYKLRLLYLVVVYRKNISSHIENTEISIADSLPEREYSMHGFRAIIRRNTDDFYLLFLDRERIYSYLALYEGETFLDVGANVGYYTLRVAADYKKLKVKIISIEAHPLTYRALTRNVQLNEFYNIETINKAVGDRTGLVTMYDHLDKKKRVISGHSSICNSSDRLATYEVDISTIDDLLQGRPVDVIKVDVEGAEEQVLRGATRSLKHVRRIVVEIHEGNIEPIEGILKTSGFSVATTGRGRFVVGTKH